MRKSQNLMETQLKELKLKVDESNTKNTFKP